MSSNVVNQQPYLRTSRAFPIEAKELSQELNKAYVDIALMMNNRTIGVFPTIKPAVTGESWFISQNKRQQTLRRVYAFTVTAPAVLTNINHGLVFTEIDGFTRLFGTYTDGTNWYGLIAGSNVAIAGQISFYISPTQIVFLTGAGAPTVTKGTVVLEWLSNRIQSNNN